MIVHGITLQPGDVLLYSRSGFFATLIKVKTWSHITHCEVVGPNNVALAARPNRGVGTFWPLDLNDVVAILRPSVPFDVSAAMAFHETTVGQAYDWLGLLRFFTVGRQSITKQFCSEHTTRVLRAGGADPFVPSYDADRVSPGMFTASPILLQLWVWRKES